MAISIEMISLANPFLSFDFDAATGGWSLHPRGSETPCIDRALAAIAFRPAAGPRSTARPRAGTLADWRVARPRRLDSAHGLTAETIFADSLRCQLEFALPRDRPFLLWRATVRNASAQAVSLYAIDLLRLGPLHRQGEVRLSSTPGRLAVFSNGYQSWSFAGALSADMRMRPSVLGWLNDAKIYNLATPRARRRGEFTSDMFGALGDRASRAGVILGFLSQREQFGVLQANLHRPSPSLRLTAQCDGVVVPPGGERTTDWAYVQFVGLDEVEPLREYVEAAARENAARVPPHTPVGWCSWYYYYDKVTEQDVLHNLEVIAEQRDRLPLDFVQLDDGWQAQVGDWFETNAKFPSGLRYLADGIRRAGQTPGLWLAPYLIRSDARLLQEHPDWFLRDERGRLVSAGNNWMRWCYSLDPTHPDVREHTRRLISTAVRDWGFPYLKLDFLYAAALPGKRRAASLTRAQAMRLALTDIREAAGLDTFILACGCPLGSAIGLVDGMRISTDVGPDWYPYLWTPLLSPVLRHEQDWTGTQNAIRNTINRVPFHRRWWLNDPDCLIARDHDTRLTEVEVRSLATAIALSGGMFLVSDDMRRLNGTQHRYIAPLMPVLDVSARAVGWLDATLPETLTLPLCNATGDWLVAGLFNWEDAARDRVIPVRTLGLDPEVEYHVSDFWEEWPYPRPAAGGEVGITKHDLPPNRPNRYWRLRAGEPLKLSAIPGHGAHLLAFRRANDTPTLVGSTFHFSQGGEISSWRTLKRGLRVRIDLGRVDEGELRLWLPAAPRAATVEGKPIPVERFGNSLYGFRFAVNRAAELRVDW